MAVVLVKPGNKVEHDFERNPRSLGLAPQGLPWRPARSLARRLAQVRLVA